MPAHQCYYHAAVTSKHKYVPTHNICYHHDIITQDINTQRTICSFTKFKVNTIQYIIAIVQS